MKIDYKFYNKEQEELSIVEEEIVKIIKEKNSDEYNEILQNDNRLGVILALSNLRQNILSWYPIKENSTILEVEANFGEITGMLCEKAKKVVSIVNSKNKAEAIEKRYEERDNLNLIVGELGDINIEEKFDYIVLNGTLELYNIRERAKDKFKYIVNKLKKNLKDDGKFLISIDNRFGMKYFTSVYEEDTIIANGNKTLQKSEIIKILNEANFCFKKFYYPLPDYKLTNVIFTDNYLPNQESISRNFTYLDKDFISFNQTEAYKEVLKDDKSKFEFFATSYFIEASQTNFEDNKIKFVSFTNIRKEKHRIKTIMYDDKVVKFALDTKSKEHIERMKKNIEYLVEYGYNTLDNPETNCIVSKYVGEAMTYDEVLLEKLKNKNFDEFYSFIEIYKNELLYKLEKGSLENNVFDKYGISYDKESIKNLNFAKYGLWDMIFQNVFYIDGKMYLFDQEWYDENVPLEFIMYRAILYFKALPRYISKEEVYKKLGIYKYIDLFKQLDDKIQLKMRDDYMWNLHIAPKSGQVLLNLFSDVSIKLAKEQQINKEKTNKILELEKKVEEYERIYRKIKDSIFWKMTKPLRDLRKNKK